MGVLFECAEIFRFNLAIVKQRHGLAGRAAIFRFAVFHMRPVFAARLHVVIPIVHLTDVTDNYLKFIHGMPLFS